MRDGLEKSLAPTSHWDLRQSMAGGINHDPSALDKSVLLLNINFSLKPQA